MKPREQRFNVMMPARVRWERSWLPANVRNVSSRGLMLRTAAPPPKGTYVDIELAGRIITGRVMWSDQQSCGFRLQDKFDVASVRGAGGGGGAAVAASAGLKHAPARRSAAETAEASRRFSSLFQFAILVAIGLATAGLLASEVYRLLSAPIEAVKSNLG